MVPRRQFTQGVNGTGPLSSALTGALLVPGSQRNRPVCPNELGSWQSDLEEDILGGVRSRIAHRGRDLELDSGTNTKRTAR